MYRGNLIELLAVVPEWNRGQYDRLGTFVKGLPCSLGGKLGSLYDICTMRQVIVVRLRSAPGKDGNVRLIVQQLPIV